MRVILDTNIWVSGLLWKGAPWQVIRLAEDGQIDIYASLDIMTELRNVLLYPHLKARQETLKKQARDLFISVLHLVTIVEPEHIEPVIPADPKDDILLACALTAGAQYLISGDKHLLNLGIWHGIQMVTVNKFLDEEFPINP